MEKKDPGPSEENSSQDEPEKAAPVPISNRAGLGGTQLNDRREIFGWVMYDWANSAFITIVITALLGPYLLYLSGRSESPLQFLGWTIEPGAIYPAAISLSVFLQVFLLPILGTVADCSPLKKRLLLGFTYVGALATILLLLAREDMLLIGTNGAILLASVLVVLANICFGAAIVVYNSFLPDITSPDQRDKVSSHGFALGYLGGGILLLLNMALLNLMEDTALALRLSLASAGLWWAFFTLLFTQRRLRQRVPSRVLPAKANLFSHGARQLLRTFRELRSSYPHTLRYLIAYLIYNDGIQTVIVVATSFAASELKVGADRLLIFVLMIQFVAVLGALGFGFLARRMGALRAIVLSLVVWSLVVVYAYLLLRTELQFFVLGFPVALVLGGSQALSRSLFSQMIPRDHEAEYFGIYEISERGTSWLGPLAFAGAIQLTGSMRSAILTLVVFFIVGLAMLSRVKVRQAMLDSGNDPSGVVL